MKAKYVGAGTRYPKFYYEGYNEKSGEVELLPEKYQIKLRKEALVGYPFEIMGVPDKKRPRLVFPEKIEVNGVTYEKTPFLFPEAEKKVYKSSLFNYDNLETNEHNLSSG